MKVLTLFIFILTLKTLSGQQILMFERDSIFLEASDTVIAKHGDENTCKIDISGSTYLQNIIVENGFVKSKITYTKSKKLVCEVNFNEGQKNGVFKLYNKEGTIDEIGYYKNGLKDSVWTYYYDNGKKQLEAKFKASLGENLDNVYQGLYRASTETGMEEILECSDEKNAYPDGEWLYYDKKGNIVNRLKFKKGKLIYYQVNEQ